MVSMRPASARSPSRGSRRCGRCTPWRGRCRRSGWLSVPPHSLAREQLGVTLFNPVTPYTSIDRALKYGVLFIALTFVTYLCIELLWSGRLHLVQYGVVSLALVLFYQTLLALSEHVAFGYAFAGAAALIVLLLSAYTWAMLKRLAFSLLIAAVLCVLYATLFVLLRLEDYALLSGTALLVLALASLMLATARLNRPGT